MWRSVNLRISWGMLPDTHAKSKTQSSPSLASPKTNISTAFQSIKKEVYTMQRIESQRQFELQNIVNQFFYKLGNSNTLVSVEIISDPNIIAQARGLKLPVLNVPFGQICVSRSLLNKLSKDEIGFVLAHEAAHIDQNHLPITILHKLPKDIIDELGKNNLDAKALSVGYEMVKLWIHSQGNLPPEAAINKQQELQADFLAVWLTGNKTAAITCLKNLVNNDLDAPSHNGRFLT